MWKINEKKIEKSFYAFSKFDLFVVHLKINSEKWNWIKIRAEKLKWFLNIVGLSKSFIIWIYCCDTCKKNFSNEVSEFSFASATQPPSANHIKKKNIFMNSSTFAIARCCSLLGGVKIAK
jgi:hypothetical protein